MEPPGARHTQHQFAADFGSVSPLILGPCRLRPRDSQSFPRLFLPHLCNSLPVNVVHVPALSFPARWVCRLPPASPMCHGTGVPEFCCLRLSGRMREGERRERERGGGQSGGRKGEGKGERGTQTEEASPWEWQSGGHISSSWCPAGPGSLCHLDGCPVPSGP